jgi:hypothetical protein
MKIRTRAKLGTSMLIVAALAAAGGAQASAGTSLPRIGTRHVILDFHPHHQTLGAVPAATGTTSVKRFSRTVTDGTSTFHIQMVGRNPFVAQTTQTTTIKTFLVPVRVILPNNDTFDPTVATSCDTGATPVTRSVQSPVFTSRAYTIGGTAVGTGQYTDIFRRAEFFAFTKPGGINPGYHTKLNVTTLARQTVHVPAGSAGEIGASACGEKTGAMDINFWDNLVVGTLLPALRAQGVTETTVPIFLFHNVVMFDGTPGNCCILGYHSLTQTAAGRQTYGNADYETSGNFGATVRDVSTLSHEVAEWLDDPFTNNPTRPWGHIGQVSGCQNNLEVGDPLSGTNVTVSTSGHTYHPQELAFFSWFYHSSPSLGVNGLFSNNGTFKTSAAPCTG